MFTWLIGGNHFFSLQLIANLRTWSYVLLTILRRENKLNRRDYNLEIKYFLQD